MEKKDKCKALNKDGKECTNKIFKNDVCKIHINKEIKMEVCDDCDNKKLENKEIKKCVGLTKIGNKCIRNGIHDGYCKIHYDKINCVNATEKNIKSLNSRHADTKYYLAKIIGSYCNKNPAIDNESMLMKQKIFGNINECFITNRKNVGVGDHLFAIREYEKSTNKCGFDDEWNRIPVDSTINKSYKIYNFKNGNKKDIGYQILTQEEINELLEEHDEGKKLNGYKLTRLQIYFKIRLWIEYIEKRGVSLYYILDENKKNLMEEHKKGFLDINKNFVDKLAIDNNIDNLEVILNAINLE